MTLEESKDFKQEQALVTGPFMMTVEDTFVIKGRGVVVSGSIERGSIRVGDELELVGMSEKVNRAKVRSIEMNGGVKPLLGESQSVLLEGIEKDQVQRGQVLAWPGSIHPHTTFEADFYMLPKAEAGRQLPVFTGLRPDFRFRNIEIEGHIAVLGAKMILAGESARIRVKLEVPLALENGLVYAIKENGRIIGTGKITRCIA